MALSAYSFSVDASGLVYTFTSTGLRTLIKKVIFTPINPYFYNTELRTEERGELLPDTENSNNGDVFSVFWTCAEIIRHFLNAHPNNAVYVSGSEEKRQRRYQRMLSDAIKGDKTLKVFGELSDGSAEPFQTDKLYVACLVFRW